MSALGVSRSQSLRSKRTDPRAIAAQALMITAGILAYLGVRSLVDESEADAFRHAARLLHFEDRLGIDVERSLQAAALGVPGLISFFNFIYVWTYWPIVIGMFFVTWFWTPASFTLYRNAMLISGAVGLVVFTLLPVAPPRFLPGFVDTIQESPGSNVISQPEGFINEFAALPSFHVGWIALASAVLFMATSRTWIRALLVLPTVLMSIAVVLTANHYVVDIIAGVGLSMLALFVAWKFEDRQVAADSTTASPSTT